MEMIGKTRRMKLRDKLSTNAIAKLTGLSRNTVKKWLKAPGDVLPKYHRESPDGSLCGSHLERFGKDRKATAPVAEATISRIFPQRPSAKFRFEQPAETLTCLSNEAFIPGCPSLFWKSHGSNSSKPKTTCSPMASQRSHS
jgi:hypothetical protein